MTEPAGAGQALPRSFLRVGGASVAQHQLGLALALDCQRVICLARGTSPELIEVQHAAEDAGLQFHIATHARQLSGLVTATDELLVVGEGLFVDPGNVMPLFEGRTPVVLVLPAEGALAAGFERIDLNRAAAGLVRVPGQLVERLHELPTDCDISSALTRIALQSGVKMREVPPAARAGTGWRLIRNETEAYAVENEWLNEQFSNGRSSPGRAIARFATITFGSSLLHAGNASNAASVAVLAVLVLAAGLGWFGVVWAGFLCAAIAWLTVEAVRLLRLAERQAMGQLPPAITRSDALGWLVDAAFGMLSLAGMPRMPGEAFLSWIFPPAMLLMLLVLVPSLLAGTAATWIRDRALLGALLALAAALGQLEIMIELLAIGLVLAALFVPMRRQD
ncbi:MAG TPA: hypothetical protein VJQ77_09405 [Novosphingobium sp.]|nr:hypothetical protein [Novosphingobium sp.]